MKIVARIMHHASRPIPVGLLEALAPLSPVVYSDAESRGAWANARLCWGSPAGEDVTHILVCHDDAIPTPSVARSIEAAVRDRPNDILSFFGTRAELTQAQTRGASWVAFDTFCWGLAVCMPVEVARCLVAWCDANVSEAWRADDTRITLFACAHNRPIYCSAPSLFQHPPGGHGVGGQANDVSPCVWKWPYPRQTWGGVFPAPGDRANFLLTRGHHMKGAT